MMFKFIRKKNKIFNVFINITIYNKIIFGSYILITISLIKFKII